MWEEQQPAELYTAAGEGWPADLYPSVSLSAFGVAPQIACVGPVYESDQVAPESEDSPPSAPPQKLEDVDSPSHPQPNSPLLPLCPRCLERLEAMKESGVLCRAGARRWEMRWRESGRTCSGVCGCREFCVEHGLPFPDCCTSVGEDAKHNVFSYRGTWVKADRASVKHELDTPDSGDEPRKRSRQMTPLLPDPSAAGVAEACAMQVPRPPAPLGTPCEKKMECFFRLQKLRSATWIASDVEGVARLREMEEASVLACQGFCRTSYCCRVHWCPATLVSTGRSVRYACSAVAEHDYHGRKNRNHADFPFYCADEACCGGKWYSRLETHNRGRSKAKMSDGIKDDLILPNAFESAPFIKAEKAEYNPVEVKSAPPIQAASLMPQVQQPVPPVLTRRGGYCDRQGLPPVLPMTQMSPSIPTIPSIPPPPYYSPYMAGHVQPYFKGPRCGCTMILLVGIALTVLLLLMASHNYRSNREATQVVACWSLYHENPHHRGDPLITSECTVCQTRFSTHHCARPDSSVDFSATILEMNSLHRYRLSTKFGVAGESDLSISLPTAVSGKLHSRNSSVAYTVVLVPQYTQIPE